MRPFLAPRYWGGHLLMVVMLAAAIGLGIWQFGSWQDQRTQKAVDLAQVAPMPITDVLGPDASFPGLDVGRPVVVRGRWDPASTVYVSDKIHDGTRGYWAVTPLVEDATGSALPIVRGWVASPGAAPAAPSGQAALTAWLQPTEDTGAPDNDPTDDVLPELTIADLVQRTPQDLYGGFAVVSHGIKAGDWPTGATAVNDGTTGLAPVPSPRLPTAGVFTGLRNLLYAIEWWIFGGFAVYVWWRWLRDESEKLRTGSGDDSGDDEDPGDAGDDPGETQDTVRVPATEVDAEVPVGARTVVS